MIRVTEIFQQIAIEDLGIGRYIGVMELLVRDSRLGYDRSGFSYGLSSFLSIEVITGSIDRETGCLDKLRLRG